MGCVVPAAPLRAEPALSIVQQMMSLDRTSDGRAGLVLQASGLDDAAMAAPAPEIADMGTPEPPTVGIEWTVSERPRLDRTRIWLLVGKVAGLPRDSRQTRYLRVSFAGTARVLDYTLTNRSDASFSWMVTGPTGLQHLGPREPVALSVVVGAIPATDVTLRREDMLEATGRTHWARGDLEMCRTRDRVCQPPGTLAANSTATLFIRARSRPDSFGHFAGTVMLAAAEKPAGDAVPLELSFTSTRRQAAGPVVIALGVILAWSVTGWGKARFSRDQLLLPAALYQEQFKALQSELEHLPVMIERGSYARTTGLLSQLIGGLSEASLVLAGYVPAIAWAAYAGSAPDPAKYKAFLDGNGQWLAVLRQIVQSGFPAVARHYVAGPPSNTAQINAAIAAVDRFAVPGPPPALADVTGAIAAADATLAGGGTRSVGARGAAASTASRAMIVRMENLSTWAWLVTALVTVAIGSYVVVLSDLGFGSPTDFLKCALWGFGLPIGAAQLGQLTAASASTNFGINVAG